MSTRYLFGPVGNEFAEDNLAAARAAGACLAFSFAPRRRRAREAGRQLGSLQSRFPAGWQPDHNPASGAVASPK